MRNLIIFTLLLVISCAHLKVGEYVEPSIKFNGKTKAVPVYMAGKITNLQKLGIIYGLEQWNYALNGNIRYEYVGKINKNKFNNQIDLIKKSGGLAIISVDSRSMSNYSKLPKNIIAFANKRFGHIIFIFNDRIGNTAIDTVIVHELSHILGMSHLNFPSIMFKTYKERKYDCIDKAMVLSVAHLNNLDWRTMRYCITEELR